MTLVPEDGCCVVCGEDEALVRVCAFHWSQGLHLWIRRGIRHDRFELPDPWSGYFIRYHLA